MFNVSGFKFLVSVAAPFQWLTPFLWAGARFKFHVLRTFLIQRFWFHGLRRSVADAVSKIQGLATLI